VLVLAAFFLLAVAGLLEVAGLGFPGLDLGIGGALVATMILGAVGALRPQRASSWGLVAFGLAALLLGLHLCLNLGVLG
jgi:hypothetical protein